MTAADATPITVLWCELDVPSVDQARAALAEREGISRKNAQRLIGVWSPDSEGEFIGSPAVADWARSEELTGVVWTALGANFPGVRGNRIL